MSLHPYELQEALHERDRRESELADCADGNPRGLLATVDSKRYVEAIHSFEGTLNAAPKFRRRERDEATQFLLMTLTDDELYALTCYGAVASARGSMLDTESEHGVRFMDNVQADAPNEYTHLGVDTFIYERMFLREDEAA